MLESLSSLLYVLGRELIVVYLFCYVFLDYLIIPRKLLYAIIGLAIFNEWGYILYCDNQLTISGQYLSSMQYVLMGLFLYREQLSKRIFLMLLLGNISFLTQTLSLVVMEQCTTSIPPITLGALVLIVSNLLLTPLCLKYLKSYKKPLFLSKTTDFMSIASLILFLNLLGTIALYDFQSPRDWHLFWGRCFNIIPALLFVQIIVYLLKELELHSNLNEKIKYIEYLRNNEQARFNHIVEVWKETRRLRHDLRHRTILLRDLLVSGQYEQLRQELIELNKATEK